MVNLDKSVIARLHLGHEVFEILVDSDQALLLKEGKNIPIEEVLADEKIFSDSRKGLVAPHTRLKAHFGTDDIFAVAKEIILKGQVQVTAEHRVKEHDEKRKRIIEYLHRNSVDPRTHSPVPLTRLELAFEEAKIHIDDHKDEMHQIDDIIKKLRPILPIKFEMRQVSVVIPAVYAGKVYPVVRKLARIIKEEWGNKGEWIGVVEIASAQQGDLFDQLGSLTHGEAQATLLKIE